jgi:hypothetical protein
MLGRDDVCILRDTRGSRPNEALLRAAVPRIEIGLKLECIPVVLALADPRDARLYPLLEGRPCRTIPRTTLGGFFRNHFSHDCLLVRVAGTISGAQALPILMIFRS